MKSSVDAPRAELNFVSQSPELASQRPSLTEIIKASPEAPMAEIDFAGESPDEFPQRASLAGTMKASAGAPGADITFTSPEAPSQPLSLAGTLEASPEQEFRAACEEVKTIKFTRSVPNDRKLKMYAL